MSEYQYYEFCSIHAPIDENAREEMYALSSRARITTHGASYVYNYSDFPDDPKKLLLKYFDVFFYISNWGDIRLMLKYPSQEINIEELNKYCISDFINYEIYNSYVVLDINFGNEDGFGWIEGEGMLSELLPLYNEIKASNYQLLRLIASYTNSEDDSYKMDTELALSNAQEAFFKYAEIDHNMFYE